MKIANLKKHLEAYDDNDHLFVLWDEKSILGPEITDKDWASACEEADKYGYFEHINEGVECILEEALDTKMSKER